jgi:hypothetical protein
MRNIVGTWVEIAQEVYQAITRIILIHLFADIKISLRGDLKNFEPPVTEAVDHME